jgi:predicted N-acetyltransferase YhbS
VHIREATYADLPAIEAVGGAAFEDEPDGEVVTMMRALAASGAARVSLVALADDEIGGHVGRSRAHEAWMVGRPVHQEAFGVTDTRGLRGPQLAEIEARSALGPGDR